MVEVKDYEFYVLIFNFEFVSICVADQVNMASDAWSSRTASGGTVCSNVISA